MCWFAVKSFHSSNKRTSTKVLKISDKNLKIRKKNEIGSFLFILILSCFSTWNTTQFSFQGRTAYLEKSINKNFVVGIFVGGNFVVRKFDIRKFVVKNFVVTDYVL